MNGALYSILALPSIRQRAVSMVILPLLFCSEFTLCFIVCLDYFVLHLIMIFDMCDALLSGPRGDIEVLHRRRRTRCQPTDPFHHQTDEQLWVDHKWHLSSISNVEPETASSPNKGLGCCSQINAFQTYLFPNIYQCYFWCNLVSLCRRQDCFRWSLLWQWWRWWWWWWRGTCFSLWSTAQ